MARIIAVWGSPDSGKTTFAVKLASSIYSRYMLPVIVEWLDLQSFVS